MKHCCLIFISLSLFFVLACQTKKTKQKADLIIHNATIYSVDSSFSVFEAMAVLNGKILELNSNETILNSYSSDSIIDVGGNFVFPGFIDSHCHFLNYGIGLGQIDLTGTTSFAEVMNRLIDYKHSLPQDKAQIVPHWISGRGWDQNDWAIKEYPSKEKLDSLFPNWPILLKRIDGHAALASSAALKLAGITPTTLVSGGSILKNEKGELSGILIDNAVDIVSRIIPPVSKNEMSEGLLKAQNNCFKMGITTVDDAGLMKSDIDVIDSLQKTGKLKMRIYAMLSDSAPNYNYYLKHGPYKTDLLNVRSFKFYADGALGSRGACLMQDYSDKPKHKGFLLNSIKHFEQFADTMYLNNFQMNTHCIGDSAMFLMICIYGITPKTAFDFDGSLFKSIAKEKRWRIEHAQVINKECLKYLKGSFIIPSIQPTHAASDMYWAEERLGKERVKYAYAYKELLNAAGMVAIGTDFPVEDISPFKTFYAAVFRKDAKGFPKNGFQPENALSRQETIKGMTIWGAYANFEEKEKGSLEKGKFADFVILNTDLMKCNENKILQTKVIATYLNGDRVYYFN